ncbi:hypothetical protein NFI95_04175 [Acetobacteraceae bacterium KSS8]|uniref:Secreted protein n=1 Tax=Endosaccharibacter trunci TaxID=2812733 RepID=A0ABT1W432_9PROT|nr:hypothetical protein [Acetobacteraceae bacterium KSS8]
MAPAALFGVALLLAGCGHSKSGSPTLSVTCDGTLMLAGATQITAASDNGGGVATLRFPDPANPGQTGTLPVPGGRSCVITPVVSTDGDQHGAAQPGH